VASAVDGLSPAQVSLVDASGHLPLGPKTGEAMRLGMEEALEAKLVETLEPVTGPGNVRASVTVDYDPTATDVTEESYDPAKIVTLSMQRTEQISGPQPVPAGVPGTASNAPNSQALPVYPQQTTPPQSAKPKAEPMAPRRRCAMSPRRRAHSPSDCGGRGQRPHGEPATGKGQPVKWQPRTA
jgi:flagellar M-ring protein FliF